MLTVTEVAGKLGVSGGLVYSFCRSGALPHHRLGGRGKRGTIRVAEADLDAFLAGCRREAAAPPPARGGKGKGPRAGDDFAGYYRRVMDRVARKGRR